MVKGHIFGGGLHECSLVSFLLLFEQVNPIAICLYNMLA